MPIPTLLRGQLCTQEPARVSPQLNPRKSPYSQLRGPRPPSFQPQTPIRASHRSLRSRSHSIKSALSIIAVLVLLLCSGVKAQDAQIGGVGIVCKSANCVQAASKIKSALIGVEYPNTISVLNEDQWHAYLAAWKPNTDTAFTNSGITYIRLRFVLDASIGTVRHTLLHEMGHIVCDSAVESCAEAFAAKHK
jgi:hypothetical protein